MFYIVTSERRATRQVALRWGAQVVEREGMLRERGVMELIYSFLVGCCWRHQ